MYEIIINKIDLGVFLFKFGLIGSELGEILKVFNCEGGKDF